MSARVCAGRTDGTVEVVMEGDLELVVGLMRVSKGIVFSFGYKMLNFLFSVLYVWSDSSDSIIPRIDRFVDPIDQSVNPPRFFLPNQASSSSGPRICRWVASP